MIRSQLKQEAKDSLRGRWGIAIGMILIYTVISLAISMVTAIIPLVGPIISIIVTVPMTFGFTGQMIKFSRGENVGFLDYFSIGFSNFGKSFSILGNTLLKILPYLIIYIIGAVVFSIVIVTLGFSTLLGFIFGISSAQANVFEGLINNLAINIDSLIIGLVILSIIWIITTIALITKYFLYILANYIGNDNPEITGKEAVKKSAELMRGHRWEYFVLELSFLGWAILASLTWGIGYLWLIPYMQVTVVKFYENLDNNNVSSNDDGEAIIYE